MILYELLSTLRFPVYMQLRDEDNIEIINTIKSDSPALSTYLNYRLVDWGIMTCNVNRCLLTSDGDDMAAIPQMFVLIKEVET